MHTHAHSKRGVCDTPQSKRRRSDSVSCPLRRFLLVHSWSRHTFRFVWSTNGKTDLICREKGCFMKFELLIRIKIKISHFIFFLLKNAKSMELIGNPFPHQRTHCRTPFPTSTFRLIALPCVLFTLPFYHLSHFVYSQIHLRLSQRRIHPFSERQKEWLFRLEQSNHKFIYWQSYRYTNTSFSLSFLFTLRSSLARSHAGKDGIQNIAHTS